MKPEFYVYNETALLLKKNGYSQEGAEYYYDSYLNKIFSWREKKMINEETDTALPSYMEAMDWLWNEGHPICLDWTPVENHFVWDGNTIKDEKMIYSDMHHTPYEVIEELIKKLYE